MIKVDNGSKHRMHRGLVKINISGEACEEWVKSRNTNENYFVEEPVNIESEHYLMFRKNGILDQIVINNSGGVDLDNPLLNAEVINMNQNDLNYLR